MFYFIRYKTIFSFLVLLMVPYNTGFSKQEKQKSVLSSTDTALNIKPSIDTPKETLIPIYALHKAYKDRNFQPLINHTTGKFRDYIQKVDQYAFENNNKFPPAIAGFSNRLKEMKIINAFMHEKNAYVTVFWILIMKSRHQTGGYYTQVFQITYLIVQEEGKWKIQNTKTSQEFAIYNK